MTNILQEWRIERRWEVAVQAGNIGECLAVLQVTGWDLLTKYLNGGLGSMGILFPVVLGCSRTLRGLAENLNTKWITYTRLEGVANPIAQADGDIEKIICFHYRAMASNLKKHHHVPTIRIPIQESTLDKKEVPIVALAKTVQKLKPWLHSYWLHGSIGSGDVKTDWSDIDGLAIVASQTFDSPKSLRKLRKRLIASRSFMLDFMPYQLHGHFVLGEPDLVSYSSAMFPSVLFQHAKCITASDSELTLGERYDRKLALEMLWSHGVADLLRCPNLAKLDTLNRIVFLHRTYLLPCLVFQVMGKPMFKRDAFKQLEMIFSAEESAIIAKACSIWSEWKRPPLSVRMLSHVAHILKFNPMLYQAFSYRLGRHLPWLGNAPSIDWTELSEAMSQVADGIWKRAQKDILGV